MKHFLSLAFLFMALYFAWRATSPPQRALFRGFVKRHALPLVVIFVGLVLALVAAVYFPALSLL